VDVDGSGTLDQAEIGKVFEMMGQNLNEKQLAKAFKMLDSDGSGSIEYPEFAKWWQEQKDKAQQRAGGTGAASQMDILLLWLLLLRMLLLRLLLRLPLLRLLLRLLL
jgi:hypothetical protein